MSLVNRKEVDKVVALVRELTPAGNSGVRDTVLASRLNVPIDRIKSLVRRYPEYFVRVGDEPKYRLNQFGNLKGEVEQIMVDIERSSERNKHIQITSVAGAVVAILIAVSSLLVLN